MCGDHPQGCNAKESACGTCASEMVLVFLSGILNVTHVGRGAPIPKACISSINVFSKEQLGWQSCRPPPTAMPVFLFLEGPGTRTHPALEACGSSHIGRRASSSCSFFKRVGVFAVFEFDATQPSTQGLKWRMPFTAWRSGTLHEFMAGPRTVVWVFTVSTILSAN